MNRLMTFVLSFVFVCAVFGDAQSFGAAGHGVSGVPSGPALNFSHSPEQLHEQYQMATQRLSSALAAIVAIPPDATNFKNTVAAFEQATADWSRATNPIAFLSAVSPDSAVREAAAVVENQMSVDIVGIYHREDLYRRFEAVAAKGEALDTADSRLLERTLKDFRENGFGLLAQEREKLKAMQERLETLSNAFSRNIAEDRAVLVVGEKGVKGLPEDFVAGLERVAEGGYKIDVGEASLLTYMRYADDAESRRQFLMKYNNRAALQNLPILSEALGLRRDIARMLGANSYPELVLKDRMAGTPERVDAFLSRIKSAVIGRARKDLDEILEIKRRFKPEATSVNPEDKFYYSRLLKQQRYDYDPEAVKAYFPVDTVIAGVMDVYQRVLGVRFRELAQGPKWHPEVRLFEILDGKTGRRIGHFYLDLYPREGKYTHAAAFTILRGRTLDDGSYEEPASAMVTNFPKAAPGKPALMTHEDAETFFHEFGHLMHQTLTQARYASFSGSAVALDFVEAPSQMMENFVWERSVIDAISGHWRDGSKIPDELFAKMVAGREFQSGLFYAGQLAYAVGDMLIHTIVPKDVSAAFNQIIAEFTGITPLPGSNFVASFGHLLGGYGAGYYSYLWSKVFAEDMYTLFKADAVISQRVGERYHREILAVGSERPEMESLRAFLGREPSEQTFMHRILGG